MFSVFCLSQSLLLIGLFAHYPGICLSSYTSTTLRSLSFLLTILKCLPKRLQVVLTSTVGVLALGQLLRGFFGRQARRSDCRSRGCFEPCVDWRRRGANTF